MTLSRLSSNRVAPYNIGTLGWDVLTVSASGPNVILSWPAMPSAVNYFVQASGLAPVSVGNVTTYTYTGLTTGQSYNFSVVGVDSAGNFSGSASQKTATPPGWNDATGGTITTVSNYNGTGQTWRVHTFTASSTFTVTNSGSPFSYLVVAGGGGAGGGGGNNAQGFTAGGGGSGGVLTNTNLTMTNIAYTITVGAGGGGGGQNPSGGSPNGANGGNSSIGALISSLGGGSGGQNGASGGSGGGGGWANGTGGGGAGTLGQGTNGNSGGGQSGGGGAGGGAGDGSSVTATGSGRFSTITGSNVEYSARYAAIGGGGGNGTAWNANGAAGNAGRVIIAYRIG